MTIRIKLVGCLRYSYKGEIFEKLDAKGAPVEYELDDAKAKALLASRNDMANDLPFFVRVTKSVVDDEDEIVIEREESADVGGVKITRRTGKAKTKARVKKGGDTSTLTDEDTRKASRDAEAEEGLEV